MTFTREDRYLVLKRSDIKNALTYTENEILLLLARKVDLWRNQGGEANIECVVVESNSPEYEPTWTAIQKRVEGE